MSLSEEELNRLIQEALRQRQLDVRTKCQHQHPERLLLSVLAAFLFANQAGAVPLSATPGIPAKLDANAAVEMGAASFSPPDLSDAQREEYEHKVAVAAAAIKQDAKNVQAHCDRARAYVWLKQYRKAIKDCNVVLHAQPENADALCVRACANYFLKRYHKAIDDAKKVSGDQKLCDYAFHVRELATKRLQYLQSTNNYGSYSACSTGASCGGASCGGGACCGGGGACGGGM